MRCLSVLLVCLPLMLAACQPPAGSSSGEAPAKARAAPAAAKEAALAAAKPAVTAAGKTAPPVRKAPVVVKDATESFRKLYADYETRVEPLAREFELGWWNAALSGKKEDFARSAELELKLKKLHSDRKLFARLAELRASGAVRDPVMARVLDILYLEFQENQIEAGLMKTLVEEANSLEQTFNTFRAKVDGKVVTANAIRKVLAESDDSALRRKHWEASKAVGPVIAARLVPLVRKRNEAARSLGYRNYYEMRLTLGEQDPAQIAQVFEDLDRVTAPLFAQEKAKLDARLARRFGVKPAELMPWHYSDVFFQESPGVEGLDLDAAFAEQDPRKTCVSFYESIGLPVVKDILARSDLYERQGKVEHAFCTHIDRKGDVRVLCNLKNDERWTGTLLHELGHGVYDANIDRQLPFVLRTPAHAFVTEGVAELFGTLTRDPEWLAVYTRMDAATRERLAGLAHEEDRLDRLIFARWSLVMVHFERQLYENPDQDLEALWWRLVTHYQGLQPPKKLAGRADWAAKIHVVTVPGYYHNYMLGRMFASQLRERIAQQFPAAVHEGRLRIAQQPRIGPFLTAQVFRYGRRYRWDELVRQSTGAPLSPRAFVSALR